MESPYTIELRAVDKLGESGGKLSFAVPTSEATLDLGEGGNSVGVGRRAHVGTEKRLDVAWNSNFEKDVRVDGDLSVGDLTSLKAALVDIFHPVGEYYISSNPTNPAELFGGTWEEVHGRFLFAEDDAHPAGSTGGEESHILTEPEIAAHKHAMAYGPESSASSTGFAYGIAAGSATNSAGGRGYASNLGTFSAGGGQPHNNMPPYLAVYTWKRTA